MLSNSLNVAEVKSKFSEVLHKAQKSPVVISNRGKEIGVLISKEYYDKLIDYEKEYEKEFVPKQRLKNFLEFSKKLRLEKKFPKQLKIPKRKNRSIPKFDS